MAKLKIEASTNLGAGQPDGHRRGKDGPMAGYLIVPGAGQLDILVQWVYDRINYGSMSWPKTSIHWTLD